MAAQLLQSCPQPSVRQQNQENAWVVIDKRTKTHNRSDLYSGMLQSKLLFNEAIPARASNRATHVGPPAPIVIERLLPLSEQCDNVNSSKSSISFTTLSEERLQAAVKLAKRDLRRRRLELLTKPPATPSHQASFFETSDAELLEELAATPSKAKLKASSPKEKQSAKDKVLVNVSQKQHISHMPRTGQSPPTRDHGPKQLERGQRASLSRDIYRLQNELEVYIQKVEELASGGEKMEEPLEPEEHKKLELRRQKQAARSARVIYVLQQQVKDIQDDIEKLQSQKMWDNKKTTTINRLAAAHRGTLRALQVVIQQLSDLSFSKVPPHYKGLGQLIRQLSLCSAKVEVDQGSSVPKSALKILEKLETLEFAIRKQEMLEKIQAQACPPRRTSSHPNTLPKSAPQGANNLTARGPRKSSNPRRGVRGCKLTPHKPKTTHYPIKRKELPRTSLESLVQQRELREQQGLKTKTICRKGQHFGRKKSEIIPKRNQMQDAGFSQPTVSSRLRVNQLPQKERSLPWMPTSPHSPPPQRSPQKERSQPRCLFSPVKPSLSSPQRRGYSGQEAELALSSEQKKQAQDEAVRNARLDKVMMRRLQELNQLSREETEGIQRLRSEIVSPTLWAERAEQKAREKIQPLLDEAQIGKSRDRMSPSLRNRHLEQAAESAAESAEQLSEALLEDLLEDTARAAWAASTDRQLEDMAQCRLQAPTLESMLLRMDEIQRDQEEVRRRFASITYSDPLYWNPPKAAAPPSCSPQPIRLTRPVMKQTSAADIVLKNPVETGLAEEASQEEQLQPAWISTAPPEPGRSRGTPISVPGGSLRNIRRYRESYETYLHKVAHEAVGSFNPWAIAESLAEDLLSEALADVAAEFQDVVEDYAEAVFTSEFLQPVQSPPAAAAAVVIS
ncbi:protein moonraker isoform X2 [Betta splendens]|uniref:Protein moonraker isoform X2 n=1 Tax=Betta splendens TaxID=158456 RepID=A0A6P7PCE5_BETSP|nr:protein moonraker isoform X2 [Betta splendens]